MNSTMIRRATALVSVLIAGSAATVLLPTDAQASPGGLSKPTVASVTASCTAQQPVVLDLTVREGTHFSHVRLRQFRQHQGDLTQRCLGDQARRHGTCALRGTGRRAGQDQRGGFRAEHP